ncbi:MAG: helix-turn-helix domain-containing protein [Bacteroidales bacterium]
MELDFNSLSSLIQFLVCLTMGSVLLTLQIPPKKELLKYRISLKVLATSYLIMAALHFAIILFKLTDYSREHLTITFIGISSVQAYLFTFALIMLFNTNVVNLKKLLLHLSPIILFFPLFFLSRYLFGNPYIQKFGDIPLHLNSPTLWIRILFYLFYIFQLIFYTRLFLKEEEKCKNHLMNYFSSEVWLKLHWVRIVFFSALGIGLVALLSNLAPTKYHWIFVLSYALFYFIFAIKYINYNKLYTIIEPAVKTIDDDANTNWHKNRIKQEWQPLKEQVLEQQYYLNSGINVEILAQHLGIGRTVLSTLINREEGVTFNIWINTLRINKAKEYLISYPDKPLSIIAEMVGYTEHPNFSRQFKIIAGESPAVWRKNHLNNV